MTFGAMAGKMEAMNNEQGTAMDTDEWAASKVRALLWMAQLNAAFFVCWLEDLEQQWE